MTPTSGALQAYVQFLEQSRKPFTGLDVTDLLSAELGAILAGPCSSVTLERAIDSALAANVPVSHVESVLLHLAAYAGLAAAECGQAALESVVARNAHLAVQPRLELDSIPSSRAGRIDFGFAAYRRFHPTRPEQQAPRFEPLSPDYYPGGMELMSHTFGDSNLSLRTREVASIACLAALGSCPDQLLFHLGIGMREGITQVQLAGILLLVQVHAGVPRAHNAAVMAAQLLTTQPLSTVASTGN